MPRPAASPPDTVRVLAVSDETSAAARWHSPRRAGGGVDVLLTHAPPRGIGDGDDAAHRGFGALHGLTRALRPTALLHGHVHPYGMRTETGFLHGTAVVNVTGWHL